jgi:hypothetical protein
VTAAQRFRYRPALSDLPKGAERSLVAQFKAIENDLNGIRGVDANSPPVLSGPAYACHVGELVRISPPASGMLLTIPPGRPENISQTIRIAVIGGILSPGATVSIVGGQGTINGAATLALNSFRLVELISCGEPGWFFST